MLLGDSDTSSIWLTPRESSLIKPILVRLVNLIYQMDKGIMADLKEFLKRGKDEFWEEK